MDRGGSPMHDREALLALYWSSGGPRWTRRGGWEDNDEDMDRWEGVALDDEGRVAKIDLSRNAMKGTIPAALGSLSHLVYLRLNSNNLTGPLPATFGNLSMLSYLDIGSNQLTGSLPKELGLLRVVSKVDLSCNKLDGQIPPEIGNMFGLLTFWLEKNQIEGPIPAELVNIPALTDLDLTGNKVEEARLQGNSLKAWKEQARERLAEAAQAESEFGGGRRGEAGSRRGSGVAPSRRGSDVDMEACLTNMLAKDHEIAVLKAEVEQLRRGRSHSGTGGVRAFWQR